MENLILRTHSNSDDSGMCSSVCECVMKRGFSGWVEGGGGLIQDKERGASQQCPRYAEQLSLADTEVGTALYHLAICHQEDYLQPSMALVRLTPA